MLRAIDTVKNPFIFVTNSASSKQAEDVLGVITFREIIMATKEHAHLAHV